MFHQYLYISNVAPTTVIGDVELLFFSSVFTKQCQQLCQKSIHHSVYYRFSHFTLSFLSRIPHCNANQFRKATTVNSMIYEWSDFAQSRKLFIITIEERKQKIREYCVNVWLHVKSAYQTFAFHTKTKQTHTNTSEKKLKRIKMREKSYCFTHLQRP